MRLSKVPPRSVTVWGRSAVLVHETVVLASTVMVDGVNSKFTILFEAWPPVWAEAAPIGAVAARHSARAAAALLGRHIVRNARRPDGPEGQKEHGADQGQGAVALPEHLDDEELGGEHPEDDDPEDRVEGDPRRRQRTSRADDARDGHHDGEGEGEAAAHSVDPDGGAWAYGDEDGSSPEPGGHRHLEPCQPEHDARQPHLP